MELCHFFLFVTFVVLTVDRFVECDDGPFELEKQDSHVSKMPLPILNFLDSGVCAVMTLSFLTNLKKCASFSNSD